MRTESDRKWGDGWLHPTSGNYPAMADRQPEYNPPTANLEDAWHNIRKRSRAGFVGEYAARIGVTVEALRDLDCQEYRGDVAAFPMSDPDRVICGVCLRAVDGRKWAVRGSRHGLFVPQSQPNGQVMVCEGATDTATLLSMGFYAIGRPSCSGCEAYVVDACRRKAVVIFADADGPGRRGAEKLARALLRRAGSVKLVEPLAGKDVREWKRRGAAVETVEAMIGAAELWC